MPLVSTLPITPGLSWASTVSSQVQEIITTYNAEELDCLNATPDDTIAWANQGTNVSVGMGIVKIPWRLPQSLGFQPFTPDGPRKYNKLDIAAPAVRVQPWDLNFEWPMVWSGSGDARLMTVDGSGTLEEFMGAGGLAPAVIGAARAYKAQLVATMFYAGYTSAALGMTATIKTVPQPGLPNGNDFFTNGTGAAGSGQGMHYSHPFRADSGRFKNAYPAYGAFASKFGASLVVMTQKPHPTLPNMTLGLQVTDVFGPTWMRDRFWKMAVQSLALQTTTSPGNLAAATTGPFSAEVLSKYNAANFLGASGFAPIRYWILPQLDNHPYFTANSNANMTTGPDGGPADMWINVCALPQKGSWCHLAGPSKDFTPFARIYGPGDPRAQSERRIRMETDLDAGVAGGLYHNVDMFFGV